MPITTTQVVLGLTVAAALLFVWYADGRTSVRGALEHRFLYGVPWGTAVTVSIVVAFYLFVQGGLRHWSEPLMLPFVTWSYFYPTGVLTAGVAHGSPAHLLSNMAATLVFAPLAEYAWSHYPDLERRKRSRGADSDGSEYDPTYDGGLVNHPWVRAVVIFPGALLGLALLTAAFSLGPGLGFSGVVFALAGFVLVIYPLPAVIATVGAGALSTLFTAFSQPILRETLDPGAPSPPAWAGIGFQAHLLGFLIGVVLGIALLSLRNRRPEARHVFFATLLFGMAQALWLIAWPGGDDSFYLYRGAGVTLVFVLTILITVAVAGRTQPLPRPLSGVARAPSRRQFSILWLVVLFALVVLLVASAVAAGESVVLVAMTVGLVALVLATPALLAVVPTRLRPGSGPTTYRQGAVVVLVVFTVLVAASGIPLSLAVVDDDSAPAGGVEVGDYTVTYAENATSGQVPGVDLGDDELFASEQSGVIVVSEQRHLWTVPIRDVVLAHDGNGTVHVGGVDWRETVHVERTGWEVTGNDTVYVVDLEVNGEVTRSFESEPATAHAQIDEQSIVIVPTAEGFDVRITRDGERIDETPLPSAGETATVGDLEIATEVVDGVDRLVVRGDGSSVQVAERETY
ncbi:rhomboid family intramembrane serine protease [Natronosalvus vescus]|uniref:rhomboid family intramembrane serine protease n=1 Tax=Natronosalvus vescus TaxID=2953881 RepID=UPI002091016E|nr:rhomboid family intramembrane serine protease [Natronosalvus vescus]